MKNRRIVAAILMLVLVLSTVSALAADQAYSFSLNLPIGNTTMYIDTTNSNQKVYAANDGTVKCSSTNAPGYGYLLCLANKKNYAQATGTRWLSYAGQKKYLAYLSGQNIVGDSYHVAGRYDNDYTGSYGIDGMFNSDKT